MFESRIDHYSNAIFWIVRISNQPKGVSFFELLCRNQLGQILLPLFIRFAACGHIIGDSFIYLASLPEVLCQRYIGFAGLRRDCVVHELRIAM